ncbi:MAG: crossover junction endodeoxyribonuclease RuvC [Deltaproteobacteria bacterium]|nr:crossover junction endodeoxyribonuclease RuvC [Deltaproteobacteria bacterium]
MRVLGIDPGSTITGYGIVEKDGARFRHVDNGLVRVSPSSPFAKRLQDIFSRIRQIIRELKPDVMAIEEVFFAKNPMSALKLGESRGVALLAAAEHELKVYEYSTREVKQAITGYGQATKDQIQKMVRQLLNLPEVATEDASDALAVALCHLQSSKMKELLEKV